MYSIIELYFINKNQVNVMLEYTTEEAKTLLEEKISTAEKSLNNIKEDLEFLRNQITTMEVSILFS